MIIHHITDLHIPDDPEDKDWGHVRGHVIRQLEYVNKSQPDLLVISGDLSMEDRSRLANEWLAAQIPSSVRTIVIPGNHDHPELVRELFGSWPWHESSEDCDLIFLDTSSCVLPEEQIDRLTNTQVNQPCLLFMHHPPCPIGGGFMSIHHSLRNQEQASAAISLSGADFVFCGHFHNDAQLALDGYELSLSPSPAYRLNLTNPEFEMVDNTPQVREIQVKNGEVSSNLISV